MVRIFVWYCFHKSQVNKTVRKVQEAVCHYNATLRQFIVDDKGTVAIVVFGLPPIFHEVQYHAPLSLQPRSIWDMYCRTNSVPV